jgi:hypothetical protein
MILPGAIKQRRRTNVTFLVFGKVTGKHIEGCRKVLQRP